MSRALLAMACLALVVPVTSPGYAAPAAAAVVLHSPVDPALPGSADLRRVVLRNDEERLVYTVEVRELAPRDRVQAVLVFHDGRGAPHRITLTGPADPAQRVRVQYNLHEPATTLRCPGLRVRWQPARDRVRATLPGDCGGTAYDRVTVITRPVGWPDLDDRVHREAALPPYARH